VSYNEKHNEANQEGNRDGTDDNRSWNCGAEGETDDAQILSLRARQQRNFLATLLLSQGTPMLLGGDEICRTQHGSNNGWCQDNEISWYDWKVGEEGERLKAFTRRLIGLRRAEPVFRREAFLAGEQSGDRRGQPVTGDSFLVLFNSHYENTVFKLPAQRFGARWTVEVTTSDDGRGDEYRARADCPVTARSITVLRRGGR